MKYSKVEIYVGAIQISLSLRQTISLRGSYICDRYVDDDTVRTWLTLIQDPEDSGTQERLYRRRSLDAILAI